jgi:hypothetical protein
MDTTTIHHIITAYNPKPPNWIPLLVDLEDHLGFSLRLSVQSGLCLLCVITNEASRLWYHENWLNVLFRNETSSSEEVSSLFTKLVFVTLLHILFRSHTLFMHSICCVRLSGLA